METIKYSSEVTNTLTTIQRSNIKYILTVIKIFTLMYIFLDDYIFQVFIAIPSKGNP